MGEGSETLLRFAPNLENSGYLLFQNVDGFQSQTHFYNFEMHWLHLGDIWDFLLVLQLWIDCSPGFEKSCAQKCSWSVGVKKCHSELFRHRLWRKLAGASRWKILRCLFSSRDGPKEMRVCTGWMVTRSVYIALRLSGSAFVNSFICPKTRFACLLLNGSVQ